MTIDLSSLTLPQLEQLRKDLEKEIPRRKAADKLNALEDLKRLAAERGFALEELVGNADKVAKKPRGPVGIKYRSKDGQEWSGRGRKPLWVVEHLNAGGKIEDLLV